MKAITIHQPWAHLIAIGEKRVENRTWVTGYRGPLAIHAGVSRASLRLGDEDRYPDMPFGAIVAVAVLVDCVEMKRPAPAEFPWNDPYAEGPYLWVLGDVRKLDRPVHYRGMQGLFDVSDSVALGAPGPFVGGCSS